MQHDYDGFPNQNIANDIARMFPNNATVITHNGLRLLMPLFVTDRPCVIVPNVDSTRVTMPEDSPIARDLNTAWDIARHADIRHPISLGVVGEGVQKSFVRRLPIWAQHVLDMPIKFPGTEIRVPRELESMVPAVQRIVDVEAQINGRFDEYYAYLSVHQAMVPAGQRMRENPYHVDGFQGPRWQEKHPVNHSYLLENGLPTVFFPDSFPLDDIDPNFDDIYAEFERMIRDRNIKPWRARDFELILMDAYCVHRGDVAQVPVFRTWMRVSWETRKFDRLGNTHNPLFAYDWEMVVRDTDPRVRPRLLAA